jgi:hypothetical protein
MARRSLGEGGRPQTNRNGDLEIAALVFASNIAIQGEIRKSSSENSPAF